VRFGPVFGVPNDACEFGDGRYCVGSDYFKGLHRRLFSIRSLLAEEDAIDVVPESEWCPRQESCSPLGRLVSDPCDQVWQRIHSDCPDCLASFSRSAGSLLVVLADEHGLDSVFFDPEGEAFSVVRRFRRGGVPQGG
jgi:hypothetical protein